MIDFKDKVLFIDKKEYNLDYKILKVLELENIIVVLFDALQNVNDFITFSNLWAYDKNGICVWIAEQPPVHFQNDYYTTFYLENERLMAHSFGTFMCTLDIQGGKILESILTR